MLKGLRGENNLVYSKKTKKPQIPSLLSSLRYLATLYYKLIPSIHAFIKVSKRVKKL